MSSTISPSACSEQDKPAAVLIIEQKYPSHIEIDIGHKTNAVTFTANNEYLVSGGREEVRVWRVHDGKQMAAMKAWETYCLAASKDGRWIAAGTGWGDVLVWDTKTYKQVLKHIEESYISALDFSHDSARLLSAWGNTATILNIETCEVVRGLPHDDRVVAAKYSPQGEWIATATETSVRTWDSNDGRLLVDINVQVTPDFNSGLLWFGNHLFVMSDSRIKQIDALTGSVVSEWPITNSSSHIAMPHHKAFVTYIAHDRNNVLFWDTSTNTHLHLDQSPKDIRSITYSPNGRLLAIVAGKRITVTPLLPHIAVSIICYLISEVSEPIFFIQIAVRSTTFPHSARRLCHVYTPHSKTLKFVSTRLRSMPGSTINSRTRKHY